MRNPGSAALTASGRQRRTLYALGFGLVHCALIFRATAADVADNYYHRGAQHYVFGEKEEAKSEIETGRRLFPEDAKLRQLAALLAQKEKEDKQKQKNSEKNQKKDSESQKQDQPSPPEKQDQSKESPDSQKQQQDQPSKNDEKQPSDSQTAQDQKEKKEKDAKDAAKQAQAQQGKKDEEGDPGEEGQAAPAVMGIMSLQQAKQLLDNQKGEERAMIFVPRVKPKSQDRLFKDW
jgi:Ca-activated chloride channel family protein